MRFQVLRTQSIEVFNKSRAVLEHHNIPYTTRVSDRSSDQSSIFAMFTSRRSALGTLFEDPKLNDTYTIYTQKKYRELARALLKYGSNY